MVQVRSAGGRSGLSWERQKVSCCSSYALSHAHVRHARRHSFVPFSPFFLTPYDLTGRSAHSSKSTSVVSLARCKVGGAAKTMEFPRAIIGWGGHGLGDVRGGVNAGIWMDAGKGGGLKRDGDDRRNVMHDNHPCRRQYVQGLGVEYDVCCDDDTGRRISYFKMSGIDPSSLQFASGMVSKLVWSQTANNGLRAHAVVTIDGDTYRVSKHGEIVLACGALETPRIILNSSFPCTPPRLGKDMLDHIVVPRVIFNLNPLSVKTHNGVFAVLLTPGGQILAQDGIKAFDAAEVLLSGVFRRR